MYVDDNHASKLTASSNANDDNFAVALGTPAKGAKKLECGSAVAKKEMIMAARKCKANMVTVLRKEKRAKSNKKIIESDSDKDDNDNFLTPCSEALDGKPLNI